MKGPHSELVAASHVLKQYTSSLETQLSRHRHAAHVLQALLQEQVSNTSEQQLAFLTFCFNLKDALTEHPSLRGLGRFLSIQRLPSAMPQWQG